MDLVPLNTENRVGNAKYADYITQLRNKNKDKLEEYMNKRKENPKFQGAMDNHEISR